MKYPKFLCTVLILLYFFDCHYSLNVEDLQLLNCNVDIKETPIKRGEEPSVPVVHVPSKQGHEYSCILPPAEEENVTEEYSADENSTDIKELLEPMQSGPCLRKRTGWWTAKVCFGLDIKQYHVKDGRIASYVISLGVYDYDYDWSNGTDQEKFLHEKQRYHSQYYVNGTECGHFVNQPNGQLRSTEIRLYCEEDVEDYIYDVEEPVTCKYIITVHTSRLCSHRQFKPPPTKKKHSVPCHPLLNEEEYSGYMEKLNGI